MCCGAYGVCVCVYVHVQAHTHRHHGKAKGKGLAGEELDVLAHEEACVSC